MVGDTKLVVIDGVDERCDWHADRDGREPPEHSASNPQTNLLY